MESQNTFGTNEVQKKSGTRGVWYRITVTLLLIFLVGGSFYLGLERGRSQALQSSLDTPAVSPQDVTILHKSDSSKSIDFGLFWKAWDLLKDKYVDKGKLDANEMMYGAIKGMLSATGDPYTTFFDPKENQSFQEDLSGVFSGIGAEIGMKGGILTVVAPLDDTPAQKAGLRAGDKILKINGENTLNMDVAKAVSLIRGPKDTEVKLLILHSGVNGSDEQPKEITVKRGTITVKSVKLEFKDNNIAYIKVSRFGDEDDTSHDFAEAIQEALRKKSSGMILDLRNNPGGYLNSAVSMASLLLPKGNVVVMEEDGNGHQEKLVAKGGDIASGIETVILINEGSASASEILSGALKDNRKNVTLIGKTSFGKGSVQEPIPLTKDTLVKITVARWLTPNGKQINNQGITPDIDVNFTSEDRDKELDPQLDKAVEVLKSKVNTAVSPS